MIIDSPYDSVEIPSSPLTPLVLRHEKTLANHPALIDGLTGDVTTYGDLAVLIRKVANGFMHHGMKKGDVIAIYAPNSPDYVIAFHGITFIGAVVTTINPMYTPAELRRQLEHSSASMLITVPALLDSALEAVSNLPENSGLHSNRDSVVVFGDSESHSSPGFDDLKEFGELAQQVAVDPDNDLLALPYSSGTTGLSKGVMITHANMVENICQFEGVQNFSPTTEDDRLIAVLPFFHIYGMMIFMSSAIYRGATVVTMPRFDLEQFLGILQDQKITRDFVAPPIVVALAKHPMVDDYDLSSVKLIFSGAAPLGAGLMKTVEQRIGCKVVQGYGLTETSPVTNVGPDAEGKRKPDSIGPPICNTQMKVIDLETGEDLEKENTGEVCIRGPQVMKGYLNNPDATNDCIDEQRWFHTGDIGYADEDGYFYIVDRVKELIKYKGYQVAPAELEALLLTHPAIADAAVIGVPDEAAGELPKAFVVTKQEATAEEVQSFVAKQVAPYKKIRLVEFIESIPKAPSGKILRRLLRDQ